MVPALILVVLLLLVGSALASVMQENVSGNTHFSLDLLGIFLVTIVGSGFFLLWGWTASLTLLAAYWAWCFLGGLSNRVQSRAKAKTARPRESGCPRCGSVVRSYVSGGSVVTECVGGCGWGFAFTNPSQPAFDSQLYDVFALIPGQDKKAALARLAVALGVPALEVDRIVEHNEPIVRGAQALEVQRIARLLAPKGIAIVVHPDFPWPLTDDA